MSKSKLKKALQSLSKEELIDVVLEAYAARKETRDYLEYWLDPDPKAALEGAVAAIQKIFFRANGEPARRISLGAASKIIKDFSASTPEPELIGTLLTSYTDIQSRWILRRRFVLTHRASAERNFIRALEYAQAHDLLETQGARLRETRARLRGIYRLMQLPEVESAAQ